MKNTDNRISERKRPMVKIVPHLWFDKEAEAAVTLYTTLFENSEITQRQKLEGTPSGDNTIYYEFTLAGEPFAAINGGPIFEKNPSISLTVQCETKDEMQILWDELIKGGRALMPLQQYPFSEWYGWVEDRFGLSWQIILAEDEAHKQKIIPSFMFSGSATGKANEAIDYYVDVFQNSSRDETYRYQADESQHADAEISHATFELMEAEFIAADNGEKVDYTFNEGVSLMVLCVTQGEIDYYWEKLSAVPEAEECGWLKDKYGVSWQIVPNRLNELLETGTSRQIEAVTQAFLEMKKINIEKLERVWDVEK